MALFLILPLLLFVRESPKFLVSVRRFSQAREVYSTIARMNKRPMFEEELEGEGRESEAQLERNSHPPSMRELLELKALRPSLMVLPLVWFTVSLINYGTSLSLGSMEGSIYVNGYFLGAAKAVANLVVVPFPDWLGRRKSIALFSLVTALSCLIYEPIKSAGELSAYICLGIVTLGSSCVFTLAYIITS